MNDLPDGVLAALEKYGSWDAVLLALRDAERYKWLRDGGLVVADGKGYPDCWTTFEGAELDAAIDADMKGS